MADPGTTIAGVRLLGGVHAIAADGSLVDLPSAPQRRLLAILALHAPRRLRSEWLADRLDITPGALRTSISRLRSIVGPAVLETSSSGYTLNADVDVARFCTAITEAAGATKRLDAFERALALWTGPALDEFAGEEWADGEIARLTELHAATVDDCADALIAARRCADAVALIEQHIAVHPYRDRPRGLLVRALAGSGRQAEALRAFHRYRTLLGEELGTEPSPDVIRIERRVATGWDGIEPDRDHEAAHEALALPFPAALRPHDRFIGRAEELALLAEELALVGATGLRTVVLDGESGIGKTTLLAAFAESAARPDARAGAASVVYARCDETGVPLQPFRTVLATCVEHAPTSLLEEHVARCGGELTRICPALAARVATAPAATVSDDATQRFLAFEAACDLLRRIAAARPLVLMLDDVQWAEPTGLLFLRHLAGNLADAPVLLVVSIRLPGEHESESLRAAMAELERSPSRRTRLAGFDDVELVDLVSSAGMLDSDDGVRRVAAALGSETGGNPLYASQLVRYWMDARRFVATDTDADPDDAAGDFDGDVPASLRDIVWSRVHGLGVNAEPVLTAASVLGTEIRTEVLVDMVDAAGIAEPDVIDVLDRATRAGLLIDSESPEPGKHFVHALVTNALYADLDRSQRVRWHMHAAHALERRPDALHADVVVQLVRHCERAGSFADAQRWSTRAGDHALEHLAPAEATEHYRVALEMATALHRPDVERADLLVRLGDAQHRAGDPDALATLEQGAALARASGARDELVRAALAANRGFMRFDERAAAYLDTVEAAVAVADRSDVATYAQLLALLAQCLHYTPDAARRVRLAHEALELASSSADRTLTARVAPAVLNALWAPANNALRGRVAAAAVAAADASGDPALQFGAHLAAWHVAVETADPVVAARSHARLRAIAAARAEPRMRWVTGLCDTFAATMDGRLDAAEVLAAATLDIGMQLGAPDAFTFFAGQLFVIGTFGGRHGELFPLMEQSVKDNPGVLTFELAYGIISEAVGRTEVAVRVLQDGMRDDFTDLAVDNMWMTSILGYAVLAIELQHAAGAEQLLPIILPFADHVAFNGVTSQGPVAAYVGKLASLVGRHELADENLRDALEICDAFGWTYHRATTLFALAQARRRLLGELDDDSRSWLTESLDLCRTGSFRSWIPQIEALASGA